MKFLLRSKIAAVTAGAVAVVLMSSSASLASWELRIWTDGVTYLASFSNECSAGANDCSGVTMCGRDVYISGAQKVLKSYQRGNKVTLIREGDSFSNALCTAKK